jgi:hypothetical protein
VLYMCCAILRAVACHKVLQEFLGACVAGALPAAAQIVGDPCLSNAAHCSQSARTPGGGIILFVSEWACVR